MICVTNDENKLIRCPLPVILLLHIIIIVVVLFFVFFSVCMPKTRVNNGTDRIPNNIHAMIIITPISIGTRVRKRRYQQREKKIFLSSFEVSSLVGTGLQTWTTVLIKVLLFNVNQQTSRYI